MTANSEDVETSIEHELDSLRQITPNPCIRKVPEFMASVPIEPLVVSIGPLYYYKEALKPFHEMKLRYLQSLLQFADRGFNLGQYIEHLREKEHEIRSHYSEKSSLSSNEFIKMMLIDSAFIILFFIMNSHFLFMATHPIGNRIELSSRVDHDLFLVENQLPFFVLCDLFVQAFGLRFPTLTFKDVACVFIRRTSLLPGSKSADTLETSRDTSNIKHLVDCLRICCLPTKLRCEQLPLNAPYAKKIRKTVKELKRVGVKFIVSESKCLLDIEFSKGVLKIPQLEIDDNTKAILRSMAVYEQCHHHYDSYIIAYLSFMDELIDTPEDVQILVQNRIIKSALGTDKEVATLFNDVTKELTSFSDPFDYAHLYQELDAYANIKLNYWKAVLKKNYFNHPWSVMSVIYLVLLFILTVLQVYTGFK